MFPFIFCLVSTNPNSFRLVPFWVKITCLQNLQEIEKEFSESHKQLKKSNEKVDIKKEERSFGFSKSFLYYIQGSDKNSTQDQLVRLEQLELSKVDFVGNRTPTYVKLPSLKS